MGNIPTLQTHASLFLYPFFVDIVSPSLLERIVTSPLWQKRESPADSSEVLYFPPEAAPLLFRNVYALNAPRAFRLAFADHPLTLSDCRLYIWNERTGCVVLDLSLTAEGHEENSSVGFPALLDFNESFRYIGDLYASHRERRSCLQVSHNGQEILSAGRIEEFLAHLIGTNHLIPAFDQRMIVFPFARVEEDPSPEWVYKFFNVDSSGYDLPDKKHVKYFLKHHLYRRWQAAGTLYGFTHYSGGCLTVSHQPSSSEFSQDWLLGQFRTIYLDLALILLFQMSTLRQLDRRLVALDLTNRASLEATVADFARFTKDSWFLRVSDQDQGRELFRLWRTIWEEDYRLMETVESKLNVLRRWFAGGG
jgi:hypothetical protein